MHIDCMDHPHVIPSSSDAGEEEKKKKSGLQCGHRKVRSSGLLLANDFDHMAWHALQQLWRPRPDVGCVRSDRHFHSHGILWEFRRQKETPVVRLVATQNTIVVEDVGQFLLDMPHSPDPSTRVWLQSTSPALSADMVLPVTVAFWNECIFHEPDEGIALVTRLFHTDAWSHLHRRPSWFRDIQQAFQESALLRITVDGTTHLSRAQWQVACMLLRPDRLLFSRREKTQLWDFAIRHVLFQVSAHGRTLRRKVLAAVQRATGCRISQKCDEWQAVCAQLAPDRVARENSMPLPLVMRNPDEIAQAPVALMCYVREHFGTT